jgi:hypothetical protein
MNIKNMMSRSAKRVNRSTIEGLAIGLVELSERDLQHISGGNPNTDTAPGCGGFIITTVTGPDGKTTTTVGPCHCNLLKGFDTIGSELLLDDNSILTPFLP